MELDFWEDKGVAITGANGFIGSWLTEELVKKGAKVTILLEPNSIIGIESIRHLKDRLTIVRGDIRDFNSVEKLVSNEVIFHLAAITQVIFAKEKPLEAFNVNANGTLNVLEAIRKDGLDTFLVFASTDKVYGEPKYLPIDEEHPLSGKSPYDAAKLAADRLVHAYNITYGIKDSIVRWSNTIGGRDSNFLRAVPDFITSVMNSKPPTIRGNGKHVRDYMYVSDAVNGIISAAERQKKSNGEAFNIGTETPTSVVELANIIIKLCDKAGKLEPVILGKHTAGEIDKQYLSNKKAREKLGWKPKFSLEQAVLKTIEWHQANPWWNDVVNRVKAHYEPLLNRGL